MTAKKENENETTGDPEEAQRVRALQGRAEALAFLKSCHD